MELTRRQSLLLLGAGLCHAGESILGQWRRIAAETDGLVGAAAFNFNSGQSVSLNGDVRFPMASVCKLPIAMNILAMVGEGKFSLRDEIEIPFHDIVPSVSIVADRWPHQKRFPLDELLELMVTTSDNTAVQTLYRMGGGPAGLAARFHQWGIGGLRIDRSERKCNLDAAGVKYAPPDEQLTPGIVEKLYAGVSPREHEIAFKRFLADPRDTATPKGAVQLLAKAFRGELLPESLTSRLIEILIATRTSPTRIKGMLPAGTIVAHKTGTTSTVHGLNGATNDAGVILSSSRKPQLAIAVFVKRSTRNDSARDQVIAKIAKAAFDDYSTN